MKEHKESGDTALPGSGPPSQVPFTVCEWCNIVVEVVFGVVALRFSCPRKK